MRLRRRKLRVAALTYRRPTISCIGCGAPMVEWRTDHGVAMDLCEACGGAWMVTADFLAMLRDRQPRLAVDELLEHNDGSPRRPCPRCGEKMTIAWLEYLKLEQCADHGVWFDRGELDRALAGDTAPRWVFAPPPPRKRVR